MILFDFKMKVNIYIKMAIDEKSRLKLTKAKFTLLYVSYFLLVFLIMHALWCCLLFFEYMSAEVFITILLQYVTCVFIYCALVFRQRIYFCFILILCFVWFFTTSSDFHSTFFPFYMPCFAFVVLSVVCILSPDVEREKSSKNYVERDIQYNHQYGQPNFSQLTPAPFI